MALGSPDGASERTGAVSSSGASAWASYTTLLSADKSDAMEKVRARAMMLGTNLDWVATEKVHGANFCFETDGSVVEYASRTRKLQPQDAFYNAFKTMPRYHDFVLEAFALVKARRPDMQRLLVYGEYFGGYFPGRRPVEGLQKVQKGVAYSPEHHFYAFDVSPDGKGFLDFDEAREILLAAGFPLVAAPLHRGAFEELLAIDVEVFETTIPGLLGLGMPSEHRIAEGLVIRPAREPRGERLGRLIVKKKARAFWEATNQPGPPRGDVASAAGLPEALLPLAREGAGMFNEARLRAVISKDPELLQERHFGRLVWLFGCDVMRDLGLQPDESAKGKAAEAAAKGQVHPLLRRAMIDFSRKAAEEMMPAIRADVGVSP